jgi:NitT/TauT family transport system permease protein
VAGTGALTRQRTRTGGLPEPLRVVWSAAWPKLAAIVIALGLWELAYVVINLVPVDRVAPDTNILLYSLPSPAQALGELWAEARTVQFWDAIRLTLTRAATGYVIAICIGLLLGLTVVRSTILRRAVGSLITGLQTMPSIAWFPLAIALFKLSETAIFFVVVLGAAPSIANSLILGVDHVSPELVRAGRILGARGLGLYRRVILPATLPTLVGGMKQGWAFAWRSLMAGELLVAVAGHSSLGVRLENDRALLDYPGLVATMIVILVIGIVMDSIFSFADNSIRRRRGLVNRAL